MSHTVFTMECICDLVESQTASSEPSREGLLPIGTQLRSDMRDRATGEIIGYNVSPGPFYGRDRYPYVVRWCDGYEGCYNVTEAGISVA